MTITPLWLQAPSFPARKRKIAELSGTIPLSIVRPSKVIKPEITKVQIIPSYAPFLPKIPLYNNLKKDEKFDEAVYGFITKHTYEQNKEEATLTHLQPDEVKELIINPDLVQSDRCGIVRVNDDGFLTLASLPDFGDFAAFPRALKIVLQWMFEKYEKTPQILQQLWRCCSPVLPSKRNEACIGIGIYTWKCHSMSPRIQLFKVCKPVGLDILISTWCSDASFHSIDGRNYEFRIECHEKVREENEGSKFSSIKKKELRLVVWNCQGVGRPSFGGNLLYLVHAHKPDIVVLLEIRTSKHLLKTIIQERACNKINGISPKHIFGGMAVLSMRKSIQFVKGCELINGIGGSIKGIAP